MIIIEVKEKTLVVSKMGIFSLVFRFPQLKHVLLTVLPCNLKLCILCATTNHYSPSVILSGQHMGHKRWSKEFDYKFIFE